MDAQEAVREHLPSRKITLNEVAKQLKTPDTNNDQAFQELIGICQVFLEMSEQDMADKFEVSRPTINRWANGKNLPHPAMRRTIYDWVRNDVARRIRTIENRGGSSGGYAMAARGR